GLLADLDGLLELLGTLDRDAALGQLRTDVDLGLSDDAVGRVRAVDHEGLDVRLGDPLLGDVPPLAGDLATSTTGVADVQLGGQRRHGAGLRPDDDRAGHGVDRVAVRPPAQHTGPRAAALHTGDPDADLARLDGLEL